MNILKATKRTTTSNGQINKLRLDGFVPAVLYGGKQTNLNISLTKLHLRDILKTETIIVIQGPLYRDKATTLPSVLTVGVGNAYVFNNGSYIEGTWRRGDISESFVISDKDGYEIDVPPSTQWVHILPNEGTVSIDN